MGHFKKIPFFCIVLPVLSLFTLEAQPKADKPPEESILIVYFTWAENTVVLDRTRAIKEANDHIYSIEPQTMVDAVTTSSVLLPGNTRKLANWIYYRTGGVFHSIQVTDPYSCYWDECEIRAVREKARSAHPVLKNRIESIEPYDVIFLGIPTWQSSLPRAVVSFLGNYDFSDKTIVPFVTYGTEGKAQTVNELKKLLPPSAEVRPEIEISRSDLNSSRADLEQWLINLGYMEPPPEEGQEES